MLLLKARKLHRNVALRSWLMWEYGIWNMGYGLQTWLCNYICQEKRCFSSKSSGRDYGGLILVPWNLRDSWIVQAQLWSENILTIWLERDGNFRMKLGLSNEEKSRLLWFWLFDNQIMYSIRVDRFRLQKRKNVKGAFWVKNKKPTILLSFTGMLFRWFLKACQEILL